MYFSPIPPLPLFLSQIYEELSFVESYEDRATHEGAVAEPDQPLREGRPLVIERLNQ